MGEKATLAMPKTPIYIGYFVLTSSGIVDGCEALPFLLGLEGSDGPSLTSEDMLSRRSPLDRRWNRTLRRDLDMMRKEENQGEGGGVKREWRGFKTRSERRKKSGVGRFMSSCESESGQLRQHERDFLGGKRMFWKKKRQRQ
jgi:hypothetical protein